MSTKTSVLSLPGEEVAEEAAEKPKAKAKPAKKKTTETAIISSNPFRKSKTVDRRAKLMVYGASGSGKTSFSLSFPDPAMIDLEGGSQQWSDKFDFAVIDQTDPNEIRKLMRWLGSSDHGYKTLIIDPLTVLWEAFQKQWSEIMLKRNKQSKGNKFDYYDFQAKDWAPIKSDLKDFFRQLLTLDMNVVCTCRTKKLYDTSGDDFMKVIGETFDAEKAMDYHFDSVVHLERDQNKFIANIKKDRGDRIGSSKLVADSPTKLANEIMKAYGLEGLSADVSVTPYCTGDQSKELFELFEALSLKEPQILKSLQKYNAKSVEELTEADAQAIIEKLNSVKSKEPKNQGEKS